MFVRSGSHLPRLEALLTLPKLITETTRSTAILRRKYAPFLQRKEGPPKKLRARHYIYELVKNTCCDKVQPIPIILTSFVENLGNVGDQVTVKASYAYNSLLLPGLAVYASPENKEFYKKYARKKDEIYYSSKVVPLTIQSMERMLLSVVMNMKNTWVLQPWHIKTSFRKCGYVVPEHAITMPQSEIKGPDMALENKDFYVTITVNKSESFNVRCRLHHWSTEIFNRIPHNGDFYKTPSEPIYPEFAEIIEKIPCKCKNSMPA